MRAEELDNLTERQLQDKANICFITAEDANFQGGDGARLRLQLEVSRRYAWFPARSGWPYASQWDASRLREKSDWTFQPENHQEVYPF